jgi:hypothetical protein
MLSFVDGISYRALNISSSLGTGAEGGLIFILASLLAG